MSQNKIRTYINIASFKLNRISLLNQSKFNPLMYKMLNIGNKNPKNYNLIKLENNHKINPLAKKHKIIKKHNILKQIDFYMTTNKVNSTKHNNNNISNELNIINNKNTNISPKNYFQNKKNNLPILMFNNYNKLFQNSKIFVKKNSNSNRINLYKNTIMKNSTSFTFKSFSSQSNLIQNNNNNIAVETSKVLKPNYTDKEIQTNDALISLNKENENNKTHGISKINNDSQINQRYKINIKSKRNFNEKSDDDSEESDYKKEIERIMTNRYDIRNLKDFSDYILNNNNKNIDMNKNKNNNYILLESLYNIKNYQNDKFYETDNINRISFKNKIIDKNLFNKINIEPRKNNLSQKKSRLLNIKYKHNKIIPKTTYIYNLANQSTESKLQNSRNSGNNY